MSKRTGIVLKNYMPNKQAVCILEQGRGKASYSTYAIESLRVGSLVRYTVHNNSMQDIALIDLPLSLAKTDLMFFHQAIELCYYFMPFDMDMPEAFILM